MSNPENLSENFLLHFVEFVFTLSWGSCYNKLRHFNKKLALFDCLVTNQILLKILKQIISVILQKLNHFLSLNLAPKLLYFRRRFKMKLILLLGHFII